MTGGGPEFITSRASLAAGVAEAGQPDEARSHLAALDELIAPYRVGAGELDTPRSAIGGPALHDTLIAAMLLGEPRWIDLAEAEIKHAALGAAIRHAVSAARALLANDPLACARALDAHYPVFEHAGFAGNCHRYAIGCVRVASAREQSLREVAEWVPVAERVRAFAERAGAKSWLKVLEDAGL